MKRWNGVLVSGICVLALALGCGDSGGGDDNGDDVLGPGDGDTTSGHVISGGTMTSSGDPIPGTSVGLTSESGQQTEISNAEGFFEFTGLEDGTYMVIPYKEGYTFQPENRIITVAGADLVNQGFMGTPIGGDSGDSDTITITVGEGLTPQISWTGGTANSLYVMDTAQWGSNYQWSITTPDGQTTGFSSPLTYGVTPQGFIEEVNLPLEPDREYRVTISRWTTEGNVIGYAYFSTEGLSTGSDGYTVSGSVVDDNRWGIAGVTVIIASAANFMLTTTTDSGGSYSFSDIPNGTYTITATHPDYEFREVMQVVTVDGANVNVSNFVED